MDSRAKQRLTGAVILVAVFVLFVPELLTGPRKTAPAETPEEGLQRYTIDLDAQTNSTPALPQSSPPAVALPPVENPMQPAPAMAIPGESAKPDSGAADQARPPLATAPAATSTARASDSGAVAALPAPKPAAMSKPVPAATPHVEAAKPAPPAAEKGSFVVQLGSFGSRENADRLVREMTAKGFATFVAPITTNGRELFRVRVGPTRDRTSAEALAAQLRRIGQSGSIVPIS